MLSALDYVEKRRPVIPSLLTWTESLTPMAAQLKTASFASSMRSAAARVLELAGQGFINTDLEAADLIERCVSYGKDDSVSERVRFFAALNIDATSMVLDYIDNRHARHGGDSNITIEIRGRTGYGKSAAALAICERLGLTPDVVQRQVVYHASPWLAAVERLYRRMVAGEKVARVVLLDESNKEVGEGAATKESVVRTQEGRLRESGISMVFCRPNVEDEQTRDLTLLALGVHLVTHKILLLAYMGPSPIGLVYLDPCSPALFAAYRPTKRGQVALSAGAKTPDAPIMRAQLLSIVCDQATMDRLAASGFRDSAIRLEIDEDYAGLYSATQMKRLAERVADVGRNYGEHGDADLFIAALDAIRTRGVYWEPDPSAWLNIRAHARAGFGAAGPRKVAVDLG